MFNRDGVSYFAVLDPDRKEQLAVGSPARRGNELGDRVVHWYDITSRTKSAKEEFLEGAVDLARFEVIPAVEPEFSFTPTNEFPEALWQKCWPLYRSQGQEGVFRYHCSGIKLAPSSVVFHTDRLQLTARCRDIAARTVTGVAEHIELWFKGQRRPPRPEKFTDELRSSLGAAVAGSTGEIVQYSFRPFCEGYAVISNKVFEALRSTEGSGTRHRPELLAAYRKAAIGLAVCSGPC